MSDSASEREPARPPVPFGGDDSLSGPGTSVERSKSLAGRRPPHGASFSSPGGEGTETPNRNTSNPETDAEHRQSSSPASQHKRRRVKGALEIFVLTRERQWSVGILSFIAASLGLLHGFTIGFASNAILDLAGEATELPPEYFFSTSLLSVFIALGPVGALFGGPIGGWVADRWGRKCSMMFCGAPYLIGYLILSYAHYAPTATAFKVLLQTGRFISGVGAGWTVAVSPVYIAEISSVKLRGIFGTLTQLLITVGFIFSFIVGAVDDFPYYYYSLVAVGIVALFEVLMIWLPETPRWLLSRGYGEDAEKILLWLRGKKIGIQRELDEMKKAITTNKAKVTHIWREFLKRSVFVPFLYVITLFFFQQAGGVGVTSLAPSLFAKAGVSNPRTTSIYAVGCASLIGNFASFVTVDLIGRTTLLILSGTGAFLGFSMLGVHFFITRPSLCDSFNSTLVESVDMAGITEQCNSHFGPLAIVGLIIYRLAFAIGLGPLPWVLVSEFLPLSVRGVASGLGNFTQQSMNAIVTGFYLQFTELVQPWFAMWTFSLTNLASVLFVMIFIPETKGKSLEEMERRFERKSKVVETIL